MHRRRPDIDEWVAALALCRELLPSVCNSFSAEQEARELIDNLGELIADDATSAWLTGDSTGDEDT